MNFEQVYGKWLQLSNTLLPTKAKYISNSAHVPRPKRLVSASYPENLGRGITEPVNHGFFLKHLLKNRKISYCETYYDDAILLQDYDICVGRKS